MMFLYTNPHKLMVSAVVSRNCMVAAVFRCCTLGEYVERDVVEATGLPSTLDESIDTAGSDPGNEIVAPAPSSGGLSSFTAFVVVEGSIY
jgi:hypothetical protein